VLFDEPSILPVDGKLQVRLGEGDKPRLRQGKFEFRSLSPDRLADRQAVELYQKAVRRRVEVAKLEVTIQTAKARTEIVLSQSHGESRGEAVWGVLLDEELPLSALFRYGLAAKMIKEPASSREQRVWNQRFRRVCESYREQAYMQFLANIEGYLHVYGQWLPTTFASDARAFYEAVIQDGRPQDATNI